MKLIHLAKNEITPEKLIEDFCPSDFGYKNDCPDDNTGRAVYDCEKCWNKESNGKNGLTPNKKEGLKELMGSVKLPFEMSKEDEKKELESRLFDAHMSTMYDLATELSEQDYDDLTEIEVNFLNALDDWHEFLYSEEE